MVCQKTKQNKPDAKFPLFLQNHNPRIPKPFILAKEFMSSVKFLMTLHHAASGQCHLAVSLHTTLFLKPAPPQMLLDSPLFS